MVTTHSRSLSGLTGNTLHHYRVKSRDAAGNLATSVDCTFTTLDSVPPAISAVALRTGANEAVVTWNTDEASDSQVEWGTTIAYGSASAVNPTMATAHRQLLGGLAGGTLYHFRVESRDAAGNLAISGDFTFTTLTPADTTSPVISLVTSTSVTGTSATITWTTDEASDSQVEYGTTTAYGNTTAINASMVKAHSQSLGGLTAKRLYHYRVKSRDAAGNLATSGDFSFTTPDLSPPVISQVANTSVSGTSATIAWTTDEASDSQVEFGTTTAYGRMTPISAVMTTAHSQSLSGLTENTLYHYRVKSRDAAGNIAASGDFTFITIDVTPPVIVAVTGLAGAGEAVISWNTNELSDTQLEYGTTTSYGNATPLNTTLAVAHRCVLESLTPGTVYHFRVKSRDVAGNLAVSGDITFATLK
jgi:phosphodiesterase/alkaline phosphatase D-like protein